ncbi:MAG: hypothetical protein WBK91_00660 [Alphaproteobacteria bacterium]
MIENFTAESVAAQKKHLFLSRTHTFKQSFPSLVFVLSLSPAKLDAEDDVKPIPGEITVTYNSEGTPQQRLEVQEKLRSTGLLYIGKAGGDKEETYAPKGSVITHKVVQDTLVALYEANAITRSHAVIAAEAFGVGILNLPKHAEQVAPERSDVRVAPSLWKMLLPR